MKEPELENLCLILQVRGTAHVHTANKAQFYITKLDGKPNAGFSNCTRDTFIAAVRAALYDDKWLELGTLMGRWW